MKSGITSLVLLLVCAVGASAAGNNPYGVHTFIQDIMSDDYINTHLDWAASLTGPGGYVKQLMYPVGPGHTTINPQWVKFINGCYSRGLTPIIRLGTWGENGSWIKPAADSPGNYTTWANAFAAVVSQMPRHDSIPLYIEVLNECNNNMEWSGQANPTEYAQFFVQTSNAIRALGDSRIKILNCGLSPGGSYNNVQFVEACCNVPGFINAFDVWGCHPYPSVDPEYNHHDGTAPPSGFAIDSYIPELQVLASHGRSNVKIIATETSYGLGSDGEDARSDRIMRAYRDYWSKWPEVLAICPYEFCDPFGGNDNVDWVDNSSGITADKLPTVAHGQYWAVRNLSKPGHTTGCISGKVRESVFGAPLSGAQVTLNPGAVTTTTDGAGVFVFPRLAPGAYSLSVTKANYSGGSASGIGLSAEENEVRNFSLTPTAACNITGTVTDSVGGQPVQGVTVRLSPGSQVSTTGADGRYQFLGVTPSTYTVSASKLSYYAFTSPEMTLQAGESKTLDFRLGPGSPPGGASLIPDADFSFPIGGAVASGWSAEGGTGPNFLVDSSTCYSGLASQRIAPFGTSNDMVWTITNYSAVVSGQRYRIEVWCKAGSTASGNAKLIGNWYTNDMVYSGSFTGSPQPTTGSGWTCLVARGVCPPMPSSGNYGRLQVELRGEITSGYVWFDQAWCGPDYQSEDPLGAITYLTTTPMTLSTRFSWSNSTSAGAAGTKVVYRTDRYPMNAADGTVLTDVSGAPGAILSCIHSNQLAGQRYYYAFFAHSSSGGNLSRPVFATAVGTDLTPPSTPVVTDEGAYTTSADTLSANWSSQDSETGIAGYSYAIGTTRGGADVVDWADIGTAAGVTRSGLSLIPGKTYWFTVKSRNGAGLSSPYGYSDGILAVRDCSSLTDAKALADGAAVRVSGVISGLFGNCGYLQELGRTGGIRLEGSLSGVVEGQAATVIGTLATVDGERKLTGVTLQ